MIIPNCYREINLHEGNCSRLHISPGNIHLIICSLCDTYQWYNSMTTGDHVIIFGKLNQKFGSCSLAINNSARAEIPTTLIKIHERIQIHIERFRYRRKQNDVTFDTGKSSSICLSLRKSAQFENFCSLKTVKLFSNSFSAFVAGWSLSCNRVCNLFREAEFMKER